MKEIVVQQADQNLSRDDRYFNRSEYFYQRYTKFSWDPVARVVPLITKFNSIQKTRMSSRMRYGNVKD